MRMQLRADIEESMKGWYDKVGRPACQAPVLADQICDHEQQGSEHVSDSLGFCKMPQGYALMLNPDRSHYYWLRHDGAEGPIDWNKWRVYKSAKLNGESRND